MTTTTPIQLVAPATMRLSVDASKAFIAGVKAVVGGASTDPVRDMLTNVLVIMRDGVIKLVTTDSYMLFVVDVLYHDMPIGTDYEFMVRAKALEAALPKGSDRNRRIELDVFDDQLVICDAGTGATSSVRTQPGTFPDWKNLIKAEQYDGSWTEVGFNPAKLAVIMKSADKFRGKLDVPIRYRLGPTELKPHTFEMTVKDVGVFFALLMPVRLS